MSRRIQLLLVGSLALSCCWWPSSTALRDRDGITVEEACHQIYSNGKAVLCNTADQIKVLSPLAPVVYNSNYQQVDDPLDAHLYPSTFKIRDAVPSDKLEKLTLLPQCDNSFEDGYMILERVTNETTFHLNTPKVSKLADQIIPASHFTPAMVEEQYQEYSYIAESATVFQACVKDGLQAAKDRPSLAGLEGAEFDVEWGSLKISQPCNDIALDYFQRISTHLENNPQDANHRDRANLILRLVTVYWGQPQVAANLMMLFGCNTKDSFDEFLSCTIRLSDMWVDLNVFQRNIDPSGEPWECFTCGVHKVSLGYHYSFSPP